MNAVAQAFLQGTEVWVPDGDVLRLHSGAYRGSSEFARVSAIKSFRIGEGLPGSVWGTQAPQVWTELKTHFVRQELAQLSGIEAAVGFPIFKGDELSAVVVLLCGNRSTTGGCVEIWEANHDLRLLDHVGGYYGNLERFGAMSKLLQFQMGAGLPGIAWERGVPQLVEDEGRSTAFVRGSIAREYGIEGGMAIPIFRKKQLNHVLVLLSTHQTPIARAFEVWVPTPSREGLVLQNSAYTAGLDSFETASKGLELKKGQGLPGSVLQTGLPAVFDHLRGPRFVREDAAREVGLEVGIGIPVMDGENVRAVACLLS